MAYASPAPVALGKIHRDSGPSVSAQLDLFDVPATETSFLGGGTWISVQPTTDTRTSSHLQLLLNPSDEQYTDLSASYAVVECKVVKSDGSALANDPDNFDVYPVSNLPASLFDWITTAVNGVDVDHNADYGVTSYMRTLLDETEACKRGRLTGEGWIEDRATARDEADAPAAVKKERKRLIAGSRTMSYFTRFNLALDRQRRLLPPGVELRLSLHRSPTASCLMSSDANADYKVVITKLEWFVRRVTVNPAITRSHVARLVEGNEFNLRVDKHRTRAFTIPSGVSSHRVVVDSGDALPTRLAVALQPHDAHVGAYQLSPYKFAPNGLSSIEVAVDGVSVGPRLDVDFVGKRYAHAYAHTVTSLGHLRSRASNGVSYASFGDNQTVFVWSLATDLPNKDTGNYFHLKRKATLTVTVRFATPPQQPLTLLAFDEREDLFRLDLERRVTSTSGAA
jgi:hypothetical protein